MGAGFINVTADNFQTEVIQSSTPVLLDFSAAWCGPCKMLEPILGELAGEYDGRVRFAKVDIDQEQNLAAQFNISAVPTLPPGGPSAMPAPAAALSSAPPPSAAPRAAAAPAAAPAPARPAPSAAGPRPAPAPARAVVSTLDTVLAIAAAIFALAAVGTTIWMWQL